jgi:hypothetical protein
MRGLVAFSATTLFILVVMPPEARGQTSVFVGLGSTVPVGTLTDSGPFTGANAGWQGTIGVRRLIGESGLALGARIFYGKNGYDAPDDPRSKLGGIAASATWILAQGAVSPFLWTEAGFLTHRYSSAFGPVVQADEEAAPSDRAALPHGEGH